MSYTPAELAEIKENAADDIVDALSGIDNDYLDDINAHISIGADSALDGVAIIQLHYVDGPTVDAKVTVEILEVKEASE